ncbi:MAG: methyltransferase domain-containing protein [bacterium]|nr:methyltransferase domain-containing protein [bacterium]
MSTQTRRPRAHDWISAAGTLGVVVAVAAALAGRAGTAVLAAAVAIGCAAAARIASRRQPSPMPFALRFVLYLPRWPLSVARLRRILAPRSGERLLELGPGVGIYAVPVAAALAGGRLDALDVQPEMLAVLGRRARAAGVGNVVARQGDAQRLPYADASFDGAYLIGVLGEVPDPDAALRELRRVLKPDARLVVGEVLVLDPDAVRLATLCEAAARAGFVLDARLGLACAYFARFRIADAPARAVLP